MAVGEWSIKLRPDTPRRILDLCQPFALVAVFPTASPINQADSSVLASARYVGIIHRPGPQLEIGGPGLAAWLGQGDICYDTDGTATLPETLAYSTAGSTLNTWLDSHVLPGTPFTRGTTGPSGTMIGTFQWVSQRDLLEALCAHFNAEWVVRPTLQLDVASYTTLFGTTPTVVVSRNTSGRDRSWTSIQADVQTSLDVSDYASRVVVLGSAGRGAAGGSSTWKGPENVNVKATRIVNSPDIPTGSESAAATAYVALFNSLRREVKLSTEQYDVAGDLQVGKLVYLYDDEAGITDASNQVRFRGEVLRPVIVRCLGLSWPVQQGYGVAVRTPGTTPTWTDLTPYVEWEEGSAEIEIGAAQPFVQGDNLSLRADLKPALDWSAWQPYAAEWRATTTNPVIGNGTITAAFRRLGTTLDVRCSITAGTTTTYGSGTMAITMPPNCVARTGTQYQLGTALYFLPGTGAHPGTAYISGGDSTIYLAVNTSPWTYANGATNVPFTWASTAQINVNLTLEVDT